MGDHVEATGSGYADSSILINCI